MLRCVGYCCQKNNLHCEGYPPPTSRTFKNLDTLTESKTQYTANAQTVSAYGHKDKDIILEGLSDSRRSEHEVSIKELLTIPLQTKHPQPTTILGRRQSCELRAGKKLSSGLIASSPMSRLVPKPKTPPKLNAF